ncbi:MULTISPECIES: ABC transporter substrate-binding protein [unclassified Xanthobacter]|uniref:ABC transporter substrate-binding protein n=1 Tax=unclassified Xanthobacter TaxID=2623496 RepID=UPI001EE109C6|nr:MULTISPECIES: ABC transporter substrate-binding protein [unclassified Xanthobacter]
MQRREFLKSSAAVLLGAGLLPLSEVLPAAAAANDTIVVATGATINSLDLHRQGTNRASYQVAINAYDRLVKFGTKTMPDGSLSYDSTKIEPDLAESWTVSDDGKVITFKLRPNAVFSDGSPVTAQDVKWSLDRAVSLGGFPTTQMKAGLMEKPEQFEVVDDKTIKVILPRKSKLTLPDLAVPIPFIINSKVAKAHATEKDPWATEYLHRNTAGSGAFVVERWDPGQQVVYARNDKWTSGPLPGAKRVIMREIPSAATRRALIERGDVDLVFNIPDKDANELKASGKAKVVSTPIENCIYVLALNDKFGPFKDKRVRQAIAYALPYEDIFKTAAYQTGVPMWGADKAEGIAWPQPSPYKQDLEKAKALLAEAGYKDGLTVPLYINLDLASWMEPTALLIQESLAKIGVKTTIEKIPGANWRTAANVERRLEMHLDDFGGWLNYPDYYFFWTYMPGTIFNSSNYDNPEMVKLVNETLDLSVDDPAYAPNIKKMIDIAFEDVPRVPLWQPALSSAMTPKISGYEFWFHRQPDARKLTKS